METITAGLATGTRTYFRVGKLPTQSDQAGYRVSANHRDGSLEEGVSLYAGWLTDDGGVTFDLRTTDAFSALFILESGDELYRVEGTIMEETGSDGEPLLLTDDWRDLEDGWMMGEPKFPVTLTRVRPTDVRVVLS